MLNQENIKIFKLFGVSAVAIDEASRQIAEQVGDRVDFTYSQIDGDFLVRMIFSDDLDDLTIDGIVKSFMLTFNEFIYAVEDIPLAEMAFNLIKLSGRLVKTAESFTGGGLANAIVNFAGASQYFYEGLVCYDERAKMQRLGVPSALIKEHSVVSSEVAISMVQGLLNSGNCDLAVSTTGYASAPYDKKLCGICYIAVGDENVIKARRYKFSGDRQSIIKQGVNAGLFAICKILTEFTF